MGDFTKYKLSHEAEHYHKDSQRIHEEIQSLFTKKDLNTKISHAKITKQSAITQIGILITQNSLRVYITKQFTMGFHKDCKYKRSRRLLLMVYYIVF